MRSWILFFSCSISAAQEIPFSGFNPIVQRDSAGRYFVLQSTSVSGLLTTPDAAQPRFGAGTCIGGGRIPSPIPCNDLYLRKYDTDGSTLLNATYLGGTGAEFAYQLAIGPDAVFVLGTSASKDFQGDNPNGAETTLLLRLDSNLTSIQSSLRLPTLVPIDNASVSLQGLFLAGPGFIEKRDPQTFALNWHHLEGILRPFSLFVLDNGDVLTSAPNILLRLRASDGEQVFRKQIPGAIQAKLYPLAPGRVLLYGANNEEPIYRGFYSVYSYDGEAIEGNRFLGRVIESAVLQSGEFTLIGDGYRGLDTSPNAPIRCFGSLSPGFVARLNPETLEPQFTSYLGLPQAARILVQNANDLVIIEGDRIHSFAFPQPVEANSPLCLELSAANYAETSGRVNSFGGSGIEIRSVVPGDFLTFFGAGIGSESIRFEPDRAGFLPIAHKGLRVLANGRPLGILELGPNRISVAFPFNLGSQVDISLERGGRISNSTQFRSTPIRPIPLGISGLSLYTFDAVFLDGKLAGPKNPVHPGDVITIYFSGAGALDREVDAAVALHSEPLPKPVIPITASLFPSGPVELLYAGSMLGQLPGVLQVNVRTPRTHSIFGLQVLYMFFGDVSVAIPIFFAP